MGFLDTFKGHQYKNELEILQQKYNDLENLLSPEMRDAVKLQEFINELETKKSDITKQMNDLTAEYHQTKIQRQQDINKLNAEITDKKQQIISLDDAILVQEFGLYSPRY